MDWSETPAELARARAERPMLIPAPLGALRGIFTPPAPAAAPAGLCVVMPGRLRWLPLRGQVRTARALAAQGFACLRFDYHGYGESEGVGVRIDRGTPCGEDVVAAIRYLRRAHGQRAFVLWGRCFDSLSSLAAFAHEAEAIVGLLYVAAPTLEMSLEDWREKKPPAASANPAGGGPSPKSSDGLMRPWLSAAQTSGSAAPADASLPAVAPNFTKHFEALARSRARALFLYGEQDPLYQEFRVVEACLFAKLDCEARRRIEVEVWRGRIHHPENIQRERELLERMQSWAETFHPRFARNFEGLPPNGASRDGAATVARPARA